MTFHDEVTQSFENDAFKAATCLKLWLNTMSPVNSAFAMRLSDDLVILADLCQWPYYLDDATNLIILGKREL